MHPKLLEYYERELEHLRQVGSEFAKEFPAVAGRLDLEEFQCTDPYVERLLEGFAFLAARVQLQIDAEFPRFTQYLMESVYPHFLLPTPSMAIVHFTPDTTQGSLKEGPVIERDSVLHSVVEIDGQSCEYRTKHDVQLWPLELFDARYSTIDTHGLTGDNIGACLYLRFRINAGVEGSIQDLPVQRLTLYLQGAGETPMRLYQSLMADCTNVYVRDDSGKLKRIEVKPAIRTKGFAEDESLLPYSSRSFDGYRLLQEYFALPDRFMFVEFVGLEQVLSTCQDREFEIVVALNRAEKHLHNQVSHSHFALFCSPAINLFPMTADRIDLNDRRKEFHVVPDRAQPLAYEVYQIDELTALDSSNDKRPFTPLYSYGTRVDEQSPAAYYVVRRVQRQLSNKEKTLGPRTNYRGCETLLSLADAKHAPFDPRLKQLSVSVLCTNRDLPILIGNLGFVLDSGEPVTDVRCIAGPTKPRPSPAEGDLAWQMISHLSLNYLSISDGQGREGAAGLRDLLKLYCDSDDDITQKQIDGIESVVSSPVFDQLPHHVDHHGDGSTPRSFGRGIEIKVTCDENAFRGTGCFLLGCILDRFFAKYSSINSFTRTILCSTQRDEEIMRWPIRLGTRHTI